MLISRVLGAIGRFCIALGLLTLLFVAYQLWGTGILTAQAQNELEDDFDSLVEEVSQLDTELIAAAELPVEAEDDATVPEPEPEPEPDVETPEERAAREEAERQAAAELELLAKLLWQDEGDPVARLRIPAINVDWTVVAGVGTDELSKGPGHYPGTPLPGMPGNAGIAGHRTTWGAPFNRIDELEPGDEVLVETLQGDFTYRVVEQDSGKGHFIVSPDRVDVLDQDDDEYPNRITLTACHPKFSARQRIVVVAELVGEPARFVPPPDLLELVQPDLAGEDVGDGAEGDLPGDPDLPTDPEAPEAEEQAGAADADPTPAPTATPTPRPTPATGDSDDDAGEDEVETVAFADEGTGAGPASLQGFAATDDFGEGLNGDRSAILPAVMWGLAAGSIALAAGFVARRWKRWPSYALSLVPFALVLFVCFVHIDQALPSY